LTEEANRIKIILQNEKEFNQQLINGWNEVSNKFGDNRRTKILMNEPIEEAPEKILKEITIFINLNGEYMVKEGKSVLKSFKKGKVVYKMSGTTIENFYIFSNLGKCYCVNGEKFYSEPNGKIENFLKFENDEEVVGTYNPNQDKGSVFFIATRLGQIKKLEVEEITSIKKNKTFITLQDLDKVIDVKCGEGDEKVAMASEEGLIVIFEGSILSSTKLQSRGVLGMKLKLTDEICSMDLINSNTNAICTITTQGYIKKTKIEEYPTTTRGTKGRFVCKLNDDKLAEIKAVDDVNSTFYSRTFNEINLNDIPFGQRVSRGVDILKM